MATKGNLFYSELDSNLQQELDARAVAGYRRTTRDINYMVGKIANVELKSFAGKDETTRQILNLGGDSVRREEYQPTGKNGFLSETAGPSAQIFKPASTIEWVEGDPITTEFEGEKFTTPGKEALYGNYRRGNVQQRIPPYIVNASVTIGDHAQKLLNSADITISIPNMQRDLDSIESILMRPGRFCVIKFVYPDEAVITELRLSETMTATATELKKLTGLKDEQVQQKLQELSKLNVFEFSGLIINFDLSIQSDFSGQLTLKLRGISNTHTDISMIQNNVSDDPEYNSSTPINTLPTEFPGEDEFEDEDIDIIEEIDEETIYYDEQTDTYYDEDEIESLRDTSEGTYEKDFFNKLEKEKEDRNKQTLKQLEKQKKKQARQEKRAKKLKKLQSKIANIKKKLFEAKSKGAPTENLESSLSIAQKIIPSLTSTLLENVANETSKQKLKQQQFEKGLRTLELLNTVSRKRMSSYQFHHKLIEFIDIVNTYQTIQYLINISDEELYNVPDIPDEEIPAHFNTKNRGVLPNVPDDINKQAKGIFENIITSFASGSVTQTDQDLTYKGPPGGMADTRPKFAINPMSIQPIEYKTISSIPQNDPYQSLTFYATGFTNDILLEDYTIKQQEQLQQFSFAFRLCPTNYEETINEENKTTLKFTDQWFLQGEPTPDPSDTSIASWSRYITLGTLIQFLNDNIISKTKDRSDDAGVICSDKMCFSNYLPNLVSIHPEKVLLLPADDKRGTTEKYGSTIYMKDILGTNGNTPHHFPGFFDTVENETGIKSSVGCPSRIFINLQEIDNIFTSMVDKSALEFSVNQFLESISNLINDATAGAVLMKLVTHPDRIFQNKLLFYDANFSGTAIEKNAVVPYIVPMTARLTNKLSTDILKSPNLDKTPEGTKIGTIVRDFSLSSKMPASLSNYSYALMGSADNLDSKDFAPFLYLMQSSGNSKFLEKLNKEYKDNHIKHMKNLIKSKIKFGRESNSGNRDALTKALKRYIQYPADNPKSALEITSPIFTWDCSFTIDGITGFRIGDVLDFDILPSNYRKNTVFFIKGIQHSVSTDGEWTTQIQAQMRPKIS